MKYKNSPFTQTIYGELVKVYMQCYSSSVHYFLSDTTCIAGSEKYFVIRLKSPCNNEQRSLSMEVFVTTWDLCHELGPPGL